MNRIFILLFLLLPAFIHARIVEEYIPEIMLEQTSQDKSLNQNQSKFVFTFRNLYDDEKSRSMTYSIDGKTKKEKLSDNRHLEILTTPGKHIFQFYYNEEYYEIYSDSLEILPGYKNEYSIYFQKADMRIMTEKPVIYLYPETETEVSVGLNVKGRLTFTYPEYNKGWNITASPDGKITADNKSYNYLFWESDAPYVSQKEDLNNGFVVKGSETTRFLQEQLTLAGLTSEEQADFITYWAPRMLANEYNFIHFEFNEDCNRFAELNITPEPNQIYRIYMIWSPTDEEHTTKAQEIKKIEREGFTVIEWGGQELPKQTSEIEQL